MRTDDIRQDAELVDAGQAGDKEALRTLLQRNWPWLKALVCSVLHDPNDVDDALQDTCVQVISKIHTLNDPERVRGWLAVIAKRQAIALRKKRNKFSSAYDIQAADNQFDKNSQPIEKIINTELHKQLLDAVHALPEKYRQVFTLRHMSEATYNDIAGILDIPITTVQIRLVRARQMIKDNVMKKQKCRITGT